MLQAFCGSLDQTTGLRHDVSGPPRRCNLKTCPGPFLCPCPFPFHHFFPWRNGGSWSQETRLATRSALCDVASVHVDLLAARLLGSMVALKRATQCRNLRPYIAGLQIRLRAFQGEHKVQLWKQSKAPQWNIGPQLSWVHSR